MDKGSVRVGGLCYNRPMLPAEKIAHYRSQIEIARPDLVIQSLETNHEGLINDVIIINGREVFRFPKNNWAVEDLQQEGKCLELAKKYVSLTLPEWTIYEGHETENPFISYQMIPGIALRREHILRLPDAAQMALADQIGTFLFQLHHIPLTEVQTCGIGPSLTVRTGEKWLKLYADVQAELFPHLMRFAQEWVHQHFAPLVADPSWMDAPPAFMNGDLGPYHLLFNPETRLLNGIIDFGTAGIGDPAADFACLLDQYGEHFVRRLERTYPDLEHLIERARFWAGTMELQWVLGGLRNPEDPSWFMVHIGRARDVLPVGSGWG